MKKYYAIAISIICFGVFNLPNAFASVLYSGSAHDYHFNLNNPWVGSSTYMVDPDEVTSPLSAIPLLSSNNSQPAATAISNLDSTFINSLNNFGSPSVASFGGNGTIPHAGSINKFLSFWIRFNSSAGGLEVLDSPGSGSQGAALYWTSGHLELYDFSGSGNINMSATSPVVDNTTWNNIVFNWTGSNTYDVYLNGSYTQTITVGNDAAFGFASLCGLWNGNCDGAQSVTNVLIGDTPESSGYISSIWNGGTGNVICIVGDTSPSCAGGPPPSINCDVPIPIDLVYPSGTIISNSPNSWIVSSTLPENGYDCGYKVAVSWVPAIGSISPELDQTNLHVLPDSHNSNFILPIQRNWWAYWNATTTVFSYTAFVSDNNTGVVLGSASGSIVLNYLLGSNVPTGFNPDLQGGGVIVNGTFGTLGSPQFVPTSSITNASGSFYCGTTNDWLVASINFLFCLQPFALQAAAGTWQGIQTLPMLDFVTNFNGIVQGEVDPQGDILILPTSTRLAYENMTVTIPFTPQLGSSTIVMVNSSTWTETASQQQIDDSYSLQWLFAGLAPVALGMKLFFF